MLRLLEVRSQPTHMPNQDKHPDLYRLHYAVNWAIDALLHASCQTLKISELRAILDKALPDTHDKPRVIILAISQLRHLVARETKLADRHDEKYAEYRNRRQPLASTR